MRPPLRLRIINDYRRSKGGQIYSLAKKHRLPCAEIKRLINLMLTIASEDVAESAARRNIARFDKQWRGR